MSYLDYGKLQPFVAEHFSVILKPAEASGAPPFAGDYIDVVLLFGDNATDPARVGIEYRDEPFEISDPLIAAFARDAAGRMKSEGLLHQGPPVAKLVAADLTPEEPRLVVQPCDYALQAGTCLALDLPDDRFAASGGTLRSYYRRDCREPTIENNPLAICLGVCGYVLVEEQGHRFLLQVERSDRLASLAGEYGPSVAGVVDYHPDLANLDELVRKSLAAEIAEEINLHYGEFEIIPLAWAIELFRGERPQLFCLIKAPFNREELAARMESIDTSRREFKSFGFLPLFGGAVLDVKHYERLNFEARMNFVMLERYLESESRG